MNGDGIEEARAGRQKLAMAATYERREMW